MGVNASERSAVRWKRKRITGQKRTLFSKNIADNALLNLQLLAAKEVGVFLSLPEEMDMFYLIKRLWHLGKNLYLPFVQKPDEPLLWLSYRPDSVLKPDNAKILAPEFDKNAIFNAANLDVIITPLVAWNRSGNRLGMGGGFYDRTFASKTTFLLGVAYECQRSDTFTVHSWDVSLNALATENQLYTFIIGEPL